LDDPARLKAKFKTARGGRAESQTAHTIPVNTQSPGSFETEDLAGRRADPVYAPGNGGAMPPRFGCEKRRAIFFVLFGAEEF